MISTRARRKITKATPGLESHITVLTCNGARFQKELASVKNTRDGLLSVGSGSIPWRPTGLCRCGAPTTANRSS
jgi:hypothetical protein